MNEQELKQKAFPGFVEKVANEISGIQQTLSKLEQSLLKLKGENNCGNNIPVMTGAIEFQQQAQALLFGLQQVGIAHHDTHHDEDEPASMDDIDPVIHAILSSLFFGGKRGKPN